MAEYEYVDYEVDGASFDGNTIPGVPARFLSATLGFQPSSAIGAALDQTLSSDIWADDANTARADGWGTTDLRAWAAVRLGSAGLRPFVDESAETVGKKVRGAPPMKVPYTLVVGDREISTGSSEPSFRRAASSKPSPIGRVCGARS